MRQFNAFNNAEGTKSPLFLYKMFEEKVKSLLNTALEEDSSIFLIKFEIDSNYKISVIIDGDNGVTVDDCIRISRAIEHNLDREEQDFSLEVASYGASEPLCDKRQYRKNISRKLKVALADGKTIEGTLTDANEEHITLQWKAREPKPVGKGKVTVNKIREIAYNEIHKASVMITFN